MNTEDEYESIGENNDCKIFKRTQFSEDGIAEDYVNIPKSFILYILNNQTKKTMNEDNDNAILLILVWLALTYFLSIFIGYFALISLPLLMLWAWSGKKEDI